MELNELPVRHKIQMHLNYLQAFLKSGLLLRKGSLRSHLKNTSIEIGLSYEIVIPIAYY